MPEHTVAGHPAYLKVTINGNAVDGNSTEQDGFIEAFEYNHSATTQTQGGSGASLGAGSVQFGPIQFRMDEGKHTPKLKQAHVQHSTVVIEADFYRYAGDGTRVKYQTLKMEAGRCIGWESRQLAHQGEHANTLWSFVGGKFTWTHVDGGITAEYDFSKRA